MASYRCASASCRRRARRVSTTCPPSSACSSICARSSADVSPMLRTRTPSRTCSIVSSRFRKKPLRSTLSSRKARSSRGPQAISMPQSAFIESAALNASFAPVALGGFQSFSFALMLRSSSRLLDKKNRKRGNLSGAARNGRHVCFCYAPCSLA